jgi:predicted phage baseplate assembly protein
VAEYRKGIGRTGSLDTGKISLLLDRPLGLREASNPLPATGGADAESTRDARRNTPVTTLTLGRVVSLRDYQDFAMSFAGIAKAMASWSWDGDTRRVLVTVAGPDAAAVPSDSDTYLNLLDALRRQGDPFVPIDLKSYRKATFKVKLKVKVAADHGDPVVLAAVEAALRTAFGFDAVGFGQPVSLSGVIAAVHGVAGVVAVDVDRLYRTSPPGSLPILHSRLLAQPPGLAPTGELLAAEILTLDPAPLDGLEVMA